ncbi:hypothetical protein DMB65_18510 [Flavobacterium cheongpyeongense]|uniref:Uncharacterized protein n=1 Tax=Flavobacterium cheongpyeongense TaxID=2212651 RepID=A0A2V4BZ23_9FLAO|nr:hypothetical protein [Flavobacterium cheongpyeongense]PXY39244.1 hypothetical protein DMB65_18510 [Flavobacterium cheongpyeongense]
MAPSIKNYFIYTVFLVSPLTLSLYSQSKIEKNINSNWVIGEAESLKNQNQATAIITPVINLEFSKQFIVELSIPKDSFAVEAVGTDEGNTDITSKNQSKNIATYSVLAKDIIENYKYDFSETFIDILFFEDIDLARIRTI